ELQNEIERLKRVTQDLETDKGALQNRISSMEEEMNARANETPPQNNRSWSEQSVKSYSEDASELQEALHQARGENAVLRESNAELQKKVESLEEQLQSGGAQGEALAKGRRTK